MKLYLSSYKFGNEPEKLRQMISANKSLGYINNARDYAGNDPNSIQKIQEAEIPFLNDLGFKAEALDLKEYFGRKDQLKEKLSALGGVWVSGGNVFVLRQAMYLSGFDELFSSLISRKDFIYGGYSAGICILSKDLRPIDQVDDPHHYPYVGWNKTIYEGLGLFNYSFMPHYDSDHPESGLINKAIQRCIDQKWLFKALRDGEVMIQEM